MRFNNDLAGGVTLVRPALQSPNYVAGSSGWAVKVDGSAEFNNVTIRGATTSGGKALYYSGAPALGNLLMSISATAGSDEFGNAYQAGMTLYSVNGYVNTSNAADTGTTWQSDSGAAIRIGAGPGAVLEQHTPAAVTGITWEPGGTGASLGSRLGTNTPQVFIQSPYNNALASRSTITLYGNPQTSNGDVTNEVYITTARMTLTGPFSMQDTIQDYDTWHTFTPQWNNVGTATFGTNVGWWKRVGDMYLFEIYAVASAAGSGTTAVTISNLPFTPFRAGAGAASTRQRVGAHLGGVVAGTNSSVAGTFNALAFAGGAALTLDRLTGPTAIDLRGENIGASFIATIQGWMRST